MSKITAIKNNEIITVTKDDDKLIIEPEHAINDIAFMALDTMPMGGVCMPDNNTLLYYYHVLSQNGYTVAVDGELETIPYEDGVIY